MKVQPHDELGALADEVARLRQGLWDVYRILGFDTDGNATPVSLGCDIVKLVVDAATEFRKDTNEDASALVAEIKALRGE